MQDGYDLSADETRQILKRLIDDTEVTGTLKNVVETLLARREKELKVQWRILHQSDRQQRQLQELNDELELYKHHLEERVEEETAKRLQQEKMLEQQSKMAAMGEMMDAVAHQWKQPLNALSMIVEMLQSDFKEGVVDQAYIDERCELAAGQIEHMVSTLQAFRTFFRPAKAPELFALKACIDAVLLLVKDEFTKHGITVRQSGTETIMLFGIENEFKHLVLNIINNAKDAFIEREIDGREIMIRCKEEADEVVIEIVDNAGGIPAQIIDAVFKPNVTTKPEGKGTGIGLYMSSQIVEKMGGTLAVANTGEGARFTIRLPAYARIQPSGEAAAVGQLKRG